MSYEIIDELIRFGDQCHKLARTLEKSLNTHKPVNDEAVSITHTLLKLDDYKLWPTVNTGFPKFNFNINGLSVLQIHNHNEIILSDTKQTILSQYHGHDSNYKICRDFTDLSDQFDILIINQALEYMDDPYCFLRQCLDYLKPNAKLWIRLRPWSSQNGGFHHNQLNKAYAHITSEIPITNLIKYRVVKPLFTYENLISKLNLQILNKQIHHKFVDNFFMSNPGVLSTIINNLWGSMNTDEALKIMSIDTVTYLLSK